VDERFGRTPFRRPWIYRLFSPIWSLWRIRFHWRILRLIDSRNLSCLRVFRVLLFYSVVIFPIPCLAWNAAGHRLAALIAWEHLDARTISETSRLLRAHPDFERWIKRAGDNNHDRGAFIEASTWPDDIRNDKRFYNTGSDEPTPTLAGFPDMERHRNWHFVNLRLDGAPSDPPISGLLDKQLVALVRTLASRNTSANERSYALPWLIHLVGDAHQPLHTSIRTDAYRRSTPSGMICQGHRGCAATVLKRRHDPSSRPIRPRRVQPQAMRGSKRAGESPVIAATHQVRMTCRASPQNSLKTAARLLSDASLKLAIDSLRC